MQLLFTVLPFTALVGFVAAAPEANPILAFDEDMSAALIRRHEEAAPHLEARDDPCLTPCYASCTLTPGCETQCWVCCEAFDYECGHCGRNTCD